MAAHSEAVIDVASRSVKEAIGDFDTQRIGSFVMACSTGYVNPGPDLLLAKELGLRSDLRRTFIGHMGCYAALNVIKVAMDSVAARPDELVICNNTELSSAHIRESLMPGEDPVEALITQALFGDASVSMLLGSAPDGAGIQFLRTHTEQLYDQHTMMSLNIGNRSFWMTLAAGVPAVLRGEHRRLPGQTSCAAGTFAPMTSRTGESIPVARRSSASWASNCGCSRSSCARAGTFWPTPETAPRPRCCWCWKTSCESTSRAAESTACS